MSYFHPFIFRCFRVRAFCALLSISLSFVPTPFAQSTATTIIRGTITDTSGAIIPGAQITVTNQNTNIVVFRGKGTPGGTFLLPQVQTGTYPVSAEAAGLQRTTMTGIVASIAQTATIDLTMKVGEVQQEVVVNSRGEQLEKGTTADAIQYRL